MGVVVGVDVGSRSVRAVAVDQDGVIASHSTVGYDDLGQWPPGRADPECWREAIATALAKLATDTPAARSPAALAVGGQSPTAVPAEGGLAVTYNYSGGVDGGLADQQRAQVALLEAEQPDVEVSQLWDWVLASLGGPRVQARWPGDPPIDRYGDHVTTGTVVGEANGGWGVSGGTTLVAGAPDALLTFWAAGLDELHRGCDPGGRTGGLVVSMSSVDVPAGLMRMAGSALGSSMIGGPVSAHGAALDWLVLVTGQSRSSLLELAAEVPPGSRGVMFLPYLEGERAPRWQRRMTAEFLGLRSDTGPAELARAVLEGAAYGLAHIGRTLTSAGAAIDVVTCTGGPSKSRLWCEIKAAVLGTPFEVPNFRELSAYGAALAAGAGAGWWPKPGAATVGSWPRLEMTRIEPARQAGYDEGLERFIALGDAAERRLSEI